MTTEQQDWRDDVERRIQFPQGPTTTGLYELVKVTSKGDMRESWTEEETISVHRTELGAYKAGLPSYYKVRPLKVQD